jgi:hypothetical protein
MNNYRFLLPLAAALISPQLLAHHGAVTNSVLYQTDDIVELEGEMTEVFWHNPHTRGRLNVVDANGEETVWEIELGPGPQTMARRGLSADDFLGRVRVAGFVSRRGNNTFGPIHVLLPNGVEIVQGNRELRWSNERVVTAPLVADPARVAAESQTATSIFRTWGRKEGAEPEEDLSRDWLSEHGREMNAAYNPIEDNVELAECRQGMPDAMFDPVPMQIVDLGDRITFEVLEYNTKRTVYMDSDARPEPVPSPTGYSTGRWAGETLVITTTHIDWPYWSEWGLPQSEQSTLLERLSVSDGGNVLNHSLTIIDPVNFTRPFTVARTRTWAPGVEIPPYNCVVDWEDTE